MLEATRKPRIGRWRGLDALEGLLRRVGFNDYTLLLLLAAVVGLANGSGVVLFRICFEGITKWLLPQAEGHHVIEAVRAMPAWRIVLVATLGGLLVGLIHRYVIPGGEFHGVAQVINAVAFVEGRIPVLVTFTRFLTNALSIAVGASVGPEGPVIELGSGLGSAFGQWLRLSPERIRTLVGCGAAGGLAAAFNAPIAGALFALEVVLKDFGVVTFSPIIVAAVLSTAISRMALGNAPAFELPPYQIGSLWELPQYLALGVGAGLLGVLFIRTLHGTGQLCRRIPLPRPVVTMLGGLLLGLALPFLPQLYGVGYEPASTLLAGQMAWKLMLLLVFAKLMATSLSLSSGFAGGIFAPILLMGGALGGLFGAACGHLFPQYSSAVGAYSLVGMAAFMAAVTHAPITSILILFEMTGGYEVILPLMLSCIVAVAVSQSISKDSNFTLDFSVRGLEVNYGRESAILRSYFAEDLMHPTLPAVNLDTRFDQILDRFLESQENHYYVLGENDRLVGKISIHDIKSVLQEKGLSRVAISADLMQPVRYMVGRRENLEDTIMLLTSAEQEELPVVEHVRDPKLLGIITRGDILELYNREILHKDILGIKLVHRDSHASDFVDLPAKYKVDLVPVTRKLAGNSLAELGLRVKYGVQVLAIKRPGLRVAGHNVLPDPYELLSRRDRLIVVGLADDVERMKRELVA